MNLKRLRLVRDIVEPKDHFTASVELIKSFFGRNFELLQMTGISVEEQRRCLVADYGFRIGKSTMSEYKKGTMYSCSLLLIVAIKCFWLKRGYTLDVD